MKSRYFFMFSCNRSGEMHEIEIEFPFKRKACQVYRVKYGRGRV